MMPAIKTILTWFMLFGFSQSAVLRINKKDRTHQVVFKRIGNYMTDLHFHLVRIPENLSNIIETPRKALKAIETYIKNVYQQSLMYHKDHQRGNIADKHQTHLVAQLIKDTSEDNEHIIESTSINPKQHNVTYQIQTLGQNGNFNIFLVWEQHCSVCTTTSIKMQTTHKLQRIPNPSLA
jgi:ABC-type transporter MlaC component